MNLPATRAPRPAATTSDKRVAVTIVPSTSGYATLVREAARAAGANFERADPTRPSDLTGRVMVVDLTRVMAEGRLGQRVIAISQRLDLDCYEVISPEQVRARLQRTIRNLVERETLLNRLSAERDTIEALNEIGYALSGESSQANLLDTVLTQARNVLQAEGGSIYLVDGDRVRFTTSQNDTIPFRASRRELPLDETSLAGFVASRREALNIQDVYDLPPSAPYKPNFTFDKETGYRTRSMLLVPMCDRESEVIGVLALVNRKTTPGAGAGAEGAFSARDVEIAGSIASQAAVAIENHRLYREIRGLFDGFVHAAVTAIESRDPSTAGHSRRVAWLTTSLARDVSASDAPVFRGIHFDDRQLVELNYAAMLHDFGKVGVREEVLLKAEKLFAWELKEIEYRFRLSALQLSLSDNGVNGASGTLEPGGAAMAELQRDMATIRRFNRPDVKVGVLERAELERISARWATPDTAEPILNGREVHRLSIPYGTLDEQERLEIQRHVSHTYDFLRRIPWTRELREIANIAHAHHETLDGAGYPLGLTDLEIPFGAKLMTVADIYDALTAGDRPYKRAMQPAKALSILRHLAGRGRLLTEAVELFAARRYWERIPARYRVERRRG